MARIAGIPEDKFIKSYRGFIYYLPEFWNTFLGKLIPYKFTREDPETHYDYYVKEFKYPTVQENQTAPIALAYDAQNVFYAGYRTEFIVDVLIYKVNL